MITEQVDLTFPLIRIPGRLRVDKELKKQPRRDRYPVSWCLYHQVLYRLVAASGLSLINPQTEEAAFTSVAEGKGETTQLPLEAPVQKHFIVSFSQTLNIIERESVRLMLVQMIYQINDVPLLKHSFSRIDKHL